MARMEMDCIFKKNEATLFKFIAFVYSFFVYSLFIAFFCLEKLAKVLIIVYFLL